MTQHREVFSTMGTVASLTLDARFPGDKTLAAVGDIFDHYDSTYSLFKPDSDLSLIAAGRISLADASAEVLDTYSTALDWRAATNGEFTPHRPDGVIDLSGVVKAMAIRDAGEELLRLGAADWCLNVGGDILVSGTEGGTESWSVGIVDPANRIELLTVATLRHPRRACATSGSAERGSHIWTVDGGPAAFVQVTVIADDIVTADVLATAVIAGGPSALDQICATWDVDVMTADAEGNIRVTPGFKTALSTHR